jgi:serine phosphatase RsbU (regulator of sigma subunit)
MDTALLPLDFRSIEKLREQELEEARVIQNVMMPAQPLRLAGVTISHEFQPVTEVGGDYLDYFKLSDETIGLYVGDVSGKGSPRPCMRRSPSAPFAASIKPAWNPSACSLS